jgi:hypothetical protein
MTTITSPDTCLFVRPNYFSTLYDGGGGGGGGGESYNPQQTTPAHLPLPFSSSGPGQTAEFRMKTVNMKVKQTRSF